MIEVNNLTRYYGEFAALSDVSFELKDGEIVGLLGLNGAGKSTTLKILAGLIAASSGTVTIGGELLDENPQIRSKIGFLPEDPPLYIEMTVTGFLKHIGRIKGMDGGAIAKRLPEVIRLADLTGRENQVIGTLSHGYRKRVGIAQAIIHDPKLVILDEPISGLDPKQIVEMRKVVRNLGESHAVIISSHILSEISQTCDRLLVMGDGKLVAQGTEADLVQRTGAENRIVVTVRGDADAFEKFLADHEMVAKSRRTDAGEGLARAVVDMDGDKREELLPAIAAAGFGLRLVEAPEDELEEIFLGLTKEAA